MDPADPTPRHLLDRTPNYDNEPFVAVGSPSEVAVGIEEVCERLAGARVVVLEAYTGVHETDLLAIAKRLDPELLVSAADAFKPPAEIEAMTRDDLGDHPVFGHITRLHLDDFLDPARVSEIRERIDRVRGRVVVWGPGASLVARGDVVVYADMPRWEGQWRQRRGETPNLGLENAGERASLQYKRGYFVDWRVLDRHKRGIWDEVGFLLDTVGDDPLMVPRDVMDRALRATARRPFRVVPFFDPAPWGGHWMERVCGVDHDGPNLGWCFDCVPEENSLVLGFGDARMEIPAQNLVYREPKALLGEAVHGRFGPEFPIRFDFLDTVGGGNLSFQVHPLTGYIQEHFGIPYTQDESYYLLDCEPDATVYLGLREGTSPDDMMADLRRAERGGFTFPAETYANRFGVRRHDHVLIPAGTVHCSGAGSMVLEISATPYIFTFKLWDWDRLGLDGRPRPVSVDHGEANIQWDRDTTYAKRELINQITTVATGDGWVEERTGLHRAEFIETRRHWFRRACPHDESPSVRVLNLVEGEAAVVASPDDAFDPFEVHYAETFIVPPAAGPFTVEPIGEGLHATICASVRTGA